MQRRRVVYAVVVVVLLIGAVVSNSLFWRDYRQPPALAEPAGPGGGEKVRPATAAEARAAQTSITKQLIAFRKDDYKTAVTYQSLGLRQNFASVPVFRAMMKKSYPQFANYKSVQFGAVQATSSGLRVVVPVTLTGQDKVVVRAVYVMVREGGIFRVAGVQGGMAPRALPPGAPGRPGQKPHLPVGQPPTVQA